VHVAQAEEADLSLRGTALFAEAQVHRAAAPSCRRSRAEKKALTNREAFEMLVNVINHILKTSITMITPRLLFCGGLLECPRDAQITLSRPGRTICTNDT
jgi:hypothetical protein